MGSSCLGSTPWKLAFMKVIRGILFLLKVLDTKLTNYTALWCRFLADADEPSLANPLNIVLKVLLSGGLTPKHLSSHWVDSSFFSYLSRSLRPSLLSSYLRWSTHDLPSLLRLTNHMRAWMSSSILSLRAEHSSYVWS